MFPLFDQITSFLPTTNLLDMHSEWTIVNRCDCLILHHDIYLPSSFSMPLIPNLLSCSIPFPGHFHKFFQLLSTKRKKCTSYIVFLLVVLIRLEFIHYNKIGILYLFSQKCTVYELLYTSCDICILGLTMTQSSHSP